MSQFHKLTIKAISKNTENAVTISFDIPTELERTFQFKAGQYITLKTTIDGKDDEPLTPRHFLTPSAAMKTIPADKLYDDPSQQWQHIIYCMNSFWKRYSRECLPLLNKMTKWHREKDQFKINDVVAFADSKRRGKWPLAKVVDVKTNKNDKLARTVKILTTDDSGKKVRYWRSTYAGLNPTAIRK